MGGSLKLQPDLVAGALRDLEAAEELTPTVNRILRLEATEALRVLSSPESTDAQLRDAAGRWRGAFHFAQQVSKTVKSGEAVRPQEDAA